MRPTPAPHLPPCAVQFPEAIASLDPVTQLYVSVDAATKEQLKAIDRPLFADYWDRFLACLRALRDRGQRTVYRLTLLKTPGAAPPDVAPGDVGGDASSRKVASTPASKRGIKGNMDDVSAAARARAAWWTSRAAGE